MPEVGPEIPRVEELVGEEGHEHHHEGYGKFVAVAIVVTTLIGSLVAFAQAGSLRTHDQADARAERYGTLALQAAAVNRGRAEVQLDRLTLAIQQARQANSAALFDQYGSGSKEIKLTAARWNQIASETEADSAAISTSQGLPYICSPSLQDKCPASQSYYSPEVDPRFPTRYIQQGQRQAYQLTALRDSSNQAADDAEANFVSYAAALTMLAVAVFLFGYSLTPQGRTRRLLYSRVAGVLVLVAGIWALVQALSPVTTPPASSSDAFADGRVALENGDYKTAIADFTTAVNQSPRFVEAYIERSQAEYGNGFPATGTGVNSLPTTAGPNTVPALDALNSAIEDDLRARDEGSDSATLMLDLGRDLFYRGAINRSTQDLRTSAVDTEAGLETLKDAENSSRLVAAGELRLAATKLALDDESAAEDYKAGIKAMQAKGVPIETTVAAALTDLSLLETQYPDRTAKIDPIRAQIVAAGETGASTPTGKTPTGTSAVTLGGISAQPDPGHALYTVEKPGKFNPDHDVLSAQWEYKDPLHGEWAVLPEISGPVTTGGIVANGSGFASSNSSYVSGTTPATCLPPGQYRVELYVNGQLAGSDTGKGKWQPVQAAVLSKVDGDACVPLDWKPFSGGTGTDGSIAKGGKAGTLILAIPHAVLGAAAADQKALATVMDDTVKGLIGSGGVFQQLQSLAPAKSTSFFMSSDNGQYEEWSNAGIDMLSGIGTSSNGIVYVGIAWGPKDGALTQQVFLSLSPQ